MKKTQLVSLRTLLLLSLLGIVPFAGCDSGGENTNVAADADQEAIDNYNQLIQEEADRVKNSTEKKNI